jgi:hypothetical protein
MDLTNCPMCKVSVEMDSISEILMDRFNQNGYTITPEALNVFVEKCIDAFGEVSIDDVDAFCDFVERIGVFEIDEEIVKNYFKF